MIKKLLLLTGLITIIVGCKQPIVKNSLPTILSPNSEILVSPSYFKLDLRSSELSTTRLSISGENMSNSPLHIVMDENDNITATISENNDYVEIQALKDGQVTLSIANDQGITSNPITIRVSSQDDAILIIETDHINLIKGEQDVANILLTVGKDITPPLVVVFSDKTVASADIVNNSLTVTAQHSGSSSFFIEDSAGIQSNTVTIDVRDLNLNLYIVDEVSFKVNSKQILNIEYSGSDIKEPFKAITSNDNIIATVIDRTVQVEAIKEGSSTLIIEDSKGRRSNVSTIHIQALDLLLTVSAQTVLSTMNYKQNSMIIAGKDIVPLSDAKNPFTVEIEDPSLIKSYSWDYRPAEKAYYLDFFIHRAGKTSFIVKDSLGRVSNRGNLLLEDFTVSMSNRAKTINLSLGETAKDVTRFEIKGPDSTGFSVIIENPELADATINYIAGSANKKFDIDLHAKKEGQTLLFLTKNDSSIGYYRMYLNITK